MKVVVLSWGHEYPRMPGVRAGAGYTAGGGAGPVFRIFVIPSALVHSRWADHLNLACNSPEVRALPGFTSSGLQRFWIWLNVQSIELHATLLRSFPEASRLSTITEHIAPTHMALVSAQRLRTSQTTSPITVRLDCFSLRLAAPWAPHPRRPPPYRWPGPPNSRRGTAEGTESAAGSVSAAGPASSASPSGSEPQTTRVARHPADARHPVGARSHEEPRMNLHA